MELSDLLGSFREEAKAQQAHLEGLILALSSEIGRVAQSMKSEVDGWRGPFSDLELWIGNIELNDLVPLKTERKALSSDYVQLKVQAETLVPA